MTEQSRAKLEELASRIPSMGGRVLGDRLRSSASRVQPGHSIVEVGTWMGAGTAHLALGVGDAGARTPIYCYDRWVASRQEVEKAAESGVALQEGQDILPWVAKTLDPFDAPIVFRKGRIEQCTWDDGEIGLYVDDAAKEGKAFLRALRTFGPSWVPGVTVLYMMDYHMYRKFNGKRFTDQRDFFSRYPDHFIPIEAKVPGVSCAIFLYAHELAFEAAIAEFVSPMRTLRTMFGKIVCRLILRS